MESTICGGQRIATPGKRTLSWSLQRKMRYKVRKMPYFQKNWNKKADTVTETIVSITVSVMRKGNQTEQNRGKSKQKYTTFIGVEEANIATTLLNGLQLLFFQLLQ